MPPSTIEQSSRTPSNRSISSLSLKFSFLNNLTSPGSLEEFDEPRSQCAAELPRLIGRLGGDGDPTDIRLSSSSAPMPESLHHPESSASDCGDVLPSSEIVEQPVGFVISVRRAAWACDVMSSCFFRAELEVRKSLSCSVRLRTVVWYVRSASVRDR